MSELTAGSQSVASPSDKLTSKLEVDVSHPSEREEEAHISTPPSSSVRVHDRTSLSPLSTETGPAQAVEGELTPQNTRVGRVDTADNRLIAYQDPHLAACAETEKEFEKDEAPLFDTLASELAAAREAARVAELKSQEGAVEAKEWSHIRLNANKELAAAKEAMDKAEAVLAVAEQLACKGEVAAKALRATESAQQTIEKRSKQASALVTEAAHLEEETKVQEAHIFALVAAAERLNDLAQRRADIITELERREEWLKTAEKALEEEAFAELKLAEEDYEVALRKHGALRKAREEKESGQSTTVDVDQLIVEARALAERADIKATGAELTLSRAITTATRAERLSSAVLQARREVHALLRRADELVADAEQLQPGMETRAELAYENAARAEDLLTRTETNEAKNMLPKQGETADSGFTGENVEIESEDAARGLERTRADLKAAEEKARELLDEARGHKYAGAELEREAAQHAKHIERVLRDARDAHLREQLAIESVEELAEQVRARTGARLHEQWAGVVSSDAWREAAASAGEVGRT